MGKSGGDSGGGEYIIRYYRGVEKAYDDLISRCKNALRDTANSPYASYTSMTEPDIPFFGAGFTFASYPSLYDMYGKFMAGLDVEKLYNQIFTNTMTATAVSESTAIQSTFLEDEILKNSLPRLMAGMRDINAVVSSSFVIGKAVIYDAKEKAVSKYMADLRYQLIPQVAQRWQAHLNWNGSVVTTYLELVKSYYTIKFDLDRFNLEIKASDALWPWQILDYYRACVGAINGAAAGQRQPTASPVAKAASGLLGGAATGAMIGSAIPGLGSLAGAAIGGVIGLIGGLF